jgi:YHS domain-containing protein
VLLRGLLFYLMLFFIARAVWRLLQGIIQGASSSSSPGARAAPGSRATPPIMKLTRDPMCGTFVVPGKAVEFVRGRETLYFCSDACRRRYLDKA